jgi:2-oxoisovalerate dehydrogenase E1 component subunit alpha
LRIYLRDQGVWDDKKELELLEQAGKEVATAVEEYLATGDPGIESMFDYLYENMPAELEAQRARALEELG